MTSYPHRIHLSLLSLALSVSTLLTSCSPGTDPGPCETFECREISYLLTAIISGSADTDSSGGSLTLRAEFFPDAPIHGSWTFDNSVSGGRVTFNGAALTQSSAGQGDTVTYALHVTVDSLLAPEGEMNAWEVSGSGERVPEFTASAPTPIRMRFDEIATAPNDTIDHAVDLLLTWSDGSPVDSTFDFIQIIGEDEEGDFAFLTPYSFYDFSDTLGSASYVIPVDSLRRWQERFQWITLLLERETLRDVLLSNGAWVRLVFRERIGRRLFFRP